MKKTNCARRDCLNYFSRTSRAHADSEIYCLALIAHPQAACARYTPPSWMPHHADARRRNKKAE